MDWLSQYLHHHRDLVVEHWPDTVIGCSSTSHDVYLILVLLLVLLLPLLIIMLLLLKGELNPKIKLDLNDSFYPLINKYNPHIF